MPLEVLAPTSRKEFFNSYSSDLAAAGFVDFLFGREVNLPPEGDISNAHIAALAAFSAIQTGNEALFRKAYDELSRRQPQEDAPWLLNDPLFYGMVLGAVQFEVDRDWLQRTLVFRAEHTRGELREVTATLSDILSENWGSIANIRPVVLMARYHLGLDTSDTDLLNGVYRITTETPFPYRESNFLNAVYLRAFDVTILSKAPEDPAKRNATADLIGLLWKRSGFMGWFVWLAGLAAWALIALALVFFVKGLADGEFRKWIETLAVLGVPIITAIPVIPWFKKRKKIVGRIQRITLKKLFGLAPDILYPPG